MASWWTLTTLKQPSNWFYLLYKHLKKQTIRGSTLLPTRILLRMYKCRTDGLQGVWRGLTEATFQKKISTHILVTVYRRRRKKGEEATGRKAQKEEEPKRELFSSSPCLFLCFPPYLPFFSLPPSSFALTNDYPSTTLLHLVAMTTTSAVARRYTHAILIIHIWFLIVIHATKKVYNNIIIWPVYDT